VIETASENIGKITRIVSRAYFNECNRKSVRALVFHKFLVALKKEIDCGKRAIGDIRSYRGTILMAHRIIANHPPFLRFLMEEWLVEIGIRGFQFVATIKPIQLHLLAALIRDSGLAEDMLKFLEDILIATLRAYKESSDFVMQNALLQIVSAIVPKISNQKRHEIDKEENSAVNYEPKSVTVNEFCVKFPTVLYIATTDLTKSSVSNAYLIILLEILSNFEHRGESGREIIKLLSIFEQLMAHRCDKIRILAGRCFALYSEINDNTLQTIEDKVSLLFSPDPNVVHSIAFTLRFMIQRFENCTRFVTDFNSKAFKSDLKVKISNIFTSQDFHASNFFVRFHLLDLLLFLDFSGDDEVIRVLLKETNLKNHFGYKLWSDKVKLL
jgi:hypothetical protein